MQAPILTVQIGMGENILILAFVSSSSAASARSAAPSSRPSSSA